MKKFFIFLLIVNAFGNLSAEIAVKSFRKLESDMTARIDAPKKDQNGDVCAIIKVVTTQTGYIWEPDGLGIISAENKGGEYWLYVPFGAKRLTIKHPQLGILRDYLYNIPIEKATVYEMILVTGRVETTVVEEITSQWLLINPQPTDAMIYLNDQFVKSGVYQSKLKPGKYSYRVEAPLYHTEAGSVDISNSKKELNIVLKPAFGYASIYSTPEQGAKIIIDGKAINQTTPAKIDALSSGEHTIQVVKDMFEPSIQKIRIEDGQTTQVNFNLQPNFAELNIIATEGSSLFINNISKGVSTWQGKLSAGVYTVEARLDSHLTATQDVDLSIGDKKTINLQPTPIYGSLDIMTNPPGANITINGKNYGTTPNSVSKLLIGDYIVLLSKIGFATINRKATIVNGKTTELNEALANGRAVTINSTPNGVKLFIDGVEVGKTPYNGNLTYGDHNLRIENEGKKFEKTVTISQSNGVANIVLSFENNTMNELFGNSNSKGSGTTTSDGRQGNPAGSSNSGGSSWSLNGRMLAGRLSLPSFENDVEGKVTVNIRVDENGSVISATIGSPTSISDAITRNAALSAAKSTRFSAGNGIATGSITYNFKLR